MTTEVSGAPEVEVRGEVTVICKQFLALTYIEQPYQRNWLKFNCYFLQHQHHSPT